MIRGQADADGNITIQDISAPAVVKSQPKDEQPAPPRAAGYARSGKLAVVSGPNGEAEVRQGGSSAQHDIFPDTGILSSATRAGSRLIGGEIQGTDVVFVPALKSTVQVRTAAALGYLKRVPGGYEEVQQNAQPSSDQGHDLNQQPTNLDQQQTDQDQQQTDEDAPEEAPLRLDDAGEAFMSDASAKLGPDVLKGLVHRFITSGDADSILPNLAQGLGVSPDEASERFSSTMATLHSQGMAAAQAVGLDSASLEAFQAWAIAEKPGERLAAIHDLVEYGRVSKIKALTKDFLSSKGNQYDEAEVLAAQGDAKVWRANDGKLVVQTPDGVMRFSDAVKQGKVTVTKTR